MDTVDIDAGFSARELLQGLGEGVVWGALAIVLLAVGYVVVDRLTPGELGRLILVDRNVNAAVVLASGLLAIATIITTSILTSLDGFVPGVVSALAYGLLGIALLAVSFLVADRLTPGDLGEIVTNDTPSPAAWVVAANHLALGAILAAAIS
ncbi:MAG: DUF350 domain-containing protein [Actinobacteria bacterium]|nr:DUF350 domain-containing protein [Actinomycetota bacterium]